MTGPRYETSDIALASFVLSQGATLLGYCRPSPRRAVFRFRADERLHELLRLYWSRAPVAAIPVELYRSLHRLKSLVRSPSEPC